MQALRAAAPWRRHVAVKAARSGRAARYDGGGRMPYTAAQAASRNGTAVNARRTARRRTATAGTTAAALGYFAGWTAPIPASRRSGYPSPAPEMGRAVRECLAV